MSNRDMSLGQIQQTQPNWVGDFLGREFLLPGGVRLDASAFLAYPGPVNVVLTAGAAVAAVSLAVTALSAAIPAGTVLNFGAGRFAVTTQNVAAAAVAIPVFALDQAIPIAAAAVYVGSARKTVPSGTFVSRTFAQRNAGTGFHPAIAGEDEFYLTAHDVPDLAINDEVAVVRNRAGCVVKENFLPGFAGLSGALQTQLRASYITTLGAE